MAADVALLAVGLVLLLGGGRALVDGASQLARRMGVSELAVGLTVVAFGTSAPELAVNGLAALRGDAAIAFGNVIGSNMANIALVIGLCALLRPLRMESVILSREIPMMLLATIAAIILGFDGLRGEDARYDRADGLMLLLLFGVFLYYSIAEVMATRQGDPLAENLSRRVHEAPLPSIGLSIPLAIGGLLLLLAGAELTVRNAVALAEAFGVPRAVVGLTIVAFGTSLPELATSLVATWRGQTNLAVGNVVGSNIFNLLFILGVTATIAPVDIPTIGGASDLATLALLSAVLIPLAHSSGQRILRWEGAVLVVLYTAYMIWRVSP